MGRQMSRSDVLALLFDSFSSGNKVDTHVVELEDLDESRPEKEGNDVDMGQQIEEETASKASRVESDPDLSSNSEIDDTVLDEDYRPEKDDSPDNGSDTDTAQGAVSEEDAGDVLETSAVQRHRRPRPDMWKRELIKEKCLKGEIYKNPMGQERPPKTMGPPCTSQHCLKSEKRSCELLTEEHRTDIFNNFWSMPFWETRKLYIQTLVQNVPIKQKKGGVASRRTTSLLYHLQLADRRKLPVCKNLFCSALQYLADGRIRYKLDFESEWEDLPQRINIPKEPFHWVPLFPAQLPITLRKFNDLQAMKPVLPRVAHQYYDNLPHQ